MDYTTTLRAAALDVRRTTPGEDLTDQAALLLVAGIAGKLAADNQVWPAVALTALDVTERLYPEARPIELAVPTPPVDSREAGGPVVELLEALVEGYDAASRDPNVVASRALAFGAATLQLRYCVELLT
ncbi:hypothetical protein OHQ88_34315 (plasmid) [Micromonospora zamorensis]|uniref:hypothetical protein n=1 Tax=Micromonospora zamorensis TaxID=709883 RepID=UPI002E242444